jgi:hypothetical protein
MANTTIIVDTVTLEFMNYWPSNTVNPPTVIGPNPQISLETSEDPSVLRAVIVDDVVTLQEDPAKVAQRTQNQWTALRLQRDSLLSASDWRVLPFSPLTQEQQQAWADYRSALRALPQLTQDPSSVAWPEAPGSS